MIDYLQDLLKKVNEWLKYAEAKNAILIAFNTSLIFSIIKIFKPMIDSNVLNYYIITVIFLLSVSTVLLIVSFIPRLFPPWIRISKKSENDNLLYFGDIVKYSPREYIESIIRKFDFKSTKHDLEREYSRQIIINSQIAYIKFRQFEIASWFTLSAILTPVGALILSRMRT